MAKITQITIVDENTLRLEVDAQKGDEIDLLSLNEFDITHVKKMIEEGKDRVYQKKLEEERSKFKLELEKEILKVMSKSKEEQSSIIEKYKLDIMALQKEKDMLNESINEKAKIKADEEVKKYLDRINALEKENNNIKNEYEMKLLKIEYDIKAKSGEVDTILKEKDSEFKEKIHDLELDYIQKLHEKENEITRLQNDRTSLNIKRIGEDLEKWCNNEFTSYAQTGFINCTWDKDNIAIKEEGESKGSKADYIFRLFNDSSKMVELTSVACEMKSEDPLSKNQKTNESHYAKLDKDRNKKKCEYALLISELEWDQANDVPIRKVVGYEKMYMVRPQYFIPFLSVIVSLANKYQDLILAKEKEEAKFEKTNEILAKFEKFKDDVINTLLERIIKSVADINKQAKEINKAADSILATCAKIVDTQIEAVKNKIEKFDIVKISKSIDKLNQE